MLQPSTHSPARRPAGSVRFLVAPLLGLLTFGCLVAVPSLGSPYFIVPATLALMYAVLAVSWTVFCAPSQYFSLGIAAFFGVGIYTYALLIAEFPNLSLPILLALAGIGSSVLAFFVGLTTLRLRGMYFAIFTFGLSELLRHFVNWWEVNQTGTVGRWIPNLDDVIVYRYMAGLTVLAVLGAYLFRRSRFGLALRAIGDEESAAEHSGVRVTSLKIIVFSATCFFTGAAGALISTRWTYIDADFAFDPIRNTFAIMMALFGGIGVLAGPVLGAVSIGLISETVFVRFSQISRLLLGLMLVIVVLFLPQGLAGFFSGRGRHSIHRFFRRDRTGRESSPTGRLGNNG